MVRRVLLAFIFVLIINEQILVASGDYETYVLSNRHQSSSHRTLQEDQEQQQRKLHQNDKDDNDGGGGLILPAIVASISEWTSRKRVKLQMGHRRRRDEEMICYRDLGCFRDEGPFDYLDTLPAHPKSIATSFVLYTRNNAHSGGDVITYENLTSIIRSDFNASNDVKVIIHGFGSSGKRYWVKQMAEALLMMEDVNVIVVDWEKGASLPNYVQAAANSRLVAKQLAKLIVMVNTQFGIDCLRYHLIGFSLGAHIAGLAGMTLQMDGLGNVSRITGLDPASPLFEGYSPSVRLDPSDALFVDVIHSNADSLLRLGLGFTEPMGHVDFYPNGGRIQLGCQSNVFTSVTDIFTGNWDSLCNHRRAFRFFIDSLVSNCTFGAFACHSYDAYLNGDCFSCGPEEGPEAGRQCSNMGYFADRSPGRGIMYLVTRDSQPFCANQFRIRVVNSKGQGSTWGKLDLTVYSPNGYNETFTLADGDEITDKGYLQGLLVAHPRLANISYANMTYHKYKGWIYSGQDQWSIDKIEISYRTPIPGHDQDDIKTVSYCGRHQLNDTVSVTFLLMPGNCTVVEQPVVVDPTIGPSARKAKKRKQPRIARLFWQLVAVPSEQSMVRRWFSLIDEPKDGGYFFWSPFW